MNSMDDDPRFDEVLADYQPTAQIRAAAAELRNTYANKSRIFPLAYLEIVGDCHVTGDWPRLVMALLQADHETAVGAEGEALAAVRRRADWLNALDEIDEQE
jgi:hypothetical protein